MLDAPRLTKVDLSGKRVLVTGGTGFIGGRLIERLILDCGAEVRSLVRNLARVSRIARFPVEFVQGDVLDSQSVKKAVDGCDIIINCMAGTDGSAAKQRQVNFAGVRNVFDAALQAKVSRVVHVSTVMVYGATPDGILDETAPRNYNGDVYSDSKLDAEKLAFEYAEQHGLPVTVLQPTVVYGPFGPAWTTRIINDVKSGRVILVEKGEGLCNAVYLDDIVSALLLASVKDEAVGEAFLISGQEPVKWDQFYAGYERIAGCTSTSRVYLSMSEAEEIFNNLFKKKSLVTESLNILLESADLRWRVRSSSEVDASLRLARKLIPAPIRMALKNKLTRSSNGTPVPVPNKHEKPILPAHPSALRNQAAKTHVCIDKAKRLLGYEPAFDFAAGMQRTEQWARWARLVNSNVGEK